jgi:methyl-accepting chemotaxis protein
MFEIDLLIAILLMSLLFLRHISVYKDRNKINYTPVVLAIGFIAGLLHFVMLGDGAGWLLALRESMLTVIVGIILSTIMSVMSQTQNALNQHTGNLRIQSIHEEVEELKNFFGSLNSALSHVTQMENTTHEQLKNIFKEEIEALGSILNNQKFFIQKVESVLAQQQLAQEKFEEFSLSELPSLDNVVHRHIDLLRISEQDHFNQLKSVIKSSSEEKVQIHNEFIQIKNSLEKLQKSHSINGVIGAMEHEFSRMIAEFGRHIQTIGSKSESIVTTLLENETILKGSRDQSELIMQQMLLSSNHMREVNHSAKELSESLRPLGNLFGSAESLFNEFTAAKNALSELIVSLESYEKHEHLLMRKQLENIANTVLAQMEAFANKITKFENTHHQVSPKEVQELAHKVKLHQSYNGE